MKNISTFSLLNREIKLVINQKYLESVKTVVALAPQEAQWFNTVTPTYTDEYIYLHLGDHLYIPEQICSATEVDTDSQMMVSFYKELIQENSIEETNNIIQNMNCWSHSHHDMNVSPSLQDVTQFNSFIKSSLDQGLNNWQVMLIFNKKNEFYSRVYDPNTKNIYEGVSFIQTNEYDLSYIEKAAKAKFKKKPAFFPKYKSSSKLYSNGGFKYNTFPSKVVYTENYLNSSVVEDIISDLFPNKTEKSSIRTNALKATEYIELLSGNLDDSEILWLSLSLNDNKSSIKNFFDPDTVDLYLSKSRYLDVKNSIKKYFLKTSDTVNDFSNHLSFVLSLTDQGTYKDFLNCLGN